MNWQSERYFNTSHVYINQNSEIVQRNHRVISIHLMFILIVWKLPYWGSDADNFNTSHVSINRSIRNNPESLINHFNTSHVSINQGSCQQPPQPQDISIHLMFLLIVFVPSSGTKYSNFNTSHVSINPLIKWGMKEAECHFNTSHVSINRNLVAFRQLLIRFQYISCFY